MNQHHYADVWDALGDTPQQAAVMKVRSAVMIELQEWIKREALSPAAAAKVLGVTVPRVSELVQGKIGMFSIDDLIGMAAMAGFEPCIHLEKRQSQA